MPPRKTPLGVWIALASAAVLIVVDQASKLWVRENLKGEPAINVIPGFFDLVYVENRGAAWGMMQNQTLFLCSISIIMLVLVLAFRRHILEDRFIHYAVYGLLIAGIIGNLIDRLKFHFVTDFFDFHIAGKHWPVFNVADSAICIAVFLYIVTTWKKPDTPPHPVDEKA